MKLQVLRQFYRWRSIQNVQYQKGKRVCFRLRLTTNNKIRIFLLPPLWPILFSLIIGYILRVQWIHCSQSTTNMLLKKIQCDINLLVSIDCQLLFIKFFSLAPIGGCQYHRFLVEHFTVSLSANGPTIILLLSSHSITTTIRAKIYMSDS